MLGDAPRPDDARGRRDDRDYVEYPTDDPDRGTSGPTRWLLASVALMLIGLTLVWWLLRPPG